MSVPNNTQQPDQRNQALQRIDTLKVAINDDFVQAQIKSALGDAAPAFAASIIDLYSGDSYLQQCDPKLVLMQALKAAIIRLPINKSLGFAWIVPYKGAPTFQIGYKGLIQLALRTSQYRHMNADVVYKGEFKTANKLTGEFDLTGEKTSDEVVGFFAHFELLNGFSKTLFMSTERVRAHAQKYSASYSKATSAWATNFNEMAIKTVLRGLLSKYGYLSVEMANAIETDIEQDAADKVLDEVRQGANKTNFQNVEEANVISTGPGAQQAATPAAATNEEPAPKIPF